MWDKLYDLAYGATIGLAKTYKQKALELIKIKAASAYLQVLRVARTHVVLLCLSLFAVILSAVAIVVLPVAMVLVAPWTVGTKIGLLSVLGLVYALIVTLCLQNIFSEEKWMKVSGFQELLDSIDPAK